MSISADKGKLEISQLQSSSYTQDHTTTVQYMGSSTHTEYMYIYVPKTKKKATVLYMLAYILFRYIRTVNTTSSHIIFITITPSFWV